MDRKANSKPIGQMLWRLDIVVLKRVVESRMSPARPHSLMKLVCPFGRRP
jgi:hypothetical protein